MASNALRNKEIGDALRRARERHELTQLEMAERLGEGYTNTWLGNKERGERTLSADELMVFADALGETAEQVLGRSTNPAGLALRLGPYEEDLDEIQQEELVRLAGIMAELRRSPKFDQRRVAARQRQATAGPEQFEAGGEAVEVPTPPDDLSTQAESP